MQYQAYELTHALLSPMRLGVKFARDSLTLPFNPMAGTSVAATVPIGTSSDSTPTRTRTWVRRDQYLFAVSNRARRDRPAVDGVPQVSAGERIARLDGAAGLAPGGGGVHADALPANEAGQSDHTAGEQRFRGLHRVASGVW